MAIMLSQVALFISKQSIMQVLGNLLLLRLMHDKVPDQNFIRRNIMHNLVSQ